MKLARRIAGPVAIALAAWAPAARCEPLPASISPPEPFPRILSQAPEFQPIAPGVTCARYVLVTAGGPISVSVIAVATNRPDVEVNTVLASDRITSPGENVSSMARRTGAVAGLNADYFDIGNTNQPTNIVVRSGRLLRTPDKRAALVILRSAAPQIVDNSFTGSLQMSGRTLALDAVNEMPPPGGGISLLTPEFGPVAPSENLTLVALVPETGTPPFATYRVREVADNSARQPPGYYAAIGLNAYGNAGVPNPGDIVTADGDVQPAGMGNVVAAVGGGPMILRDGAWYDDPEGPNGGDYSARSPSSGAAVEPDGTLLLIQVDGRQPDRSVGVTRREFAALMRGLGARAGLAFDGGGSSALALRQLGTPEAELYNQPSDGVERPVADGIFIYSNAPKGPPHEIVASPSTVRAISGASVDLRIAAVDRSDRVAALPAALIASVEPPALGTFQAGTFTASTPGTGAIVLRSGTLRARLPVDVFASPSRVEIFPRRPNVPVAGHYRLTARAFDARGYPIALPGELPWRTNGGRISPSGIFDAASTDAEVSLTLGASYAVARVTVGSHEVPIPLRDARFLTVPRGGVGNVSDSPSGIALTYALGPAERAAYLATDVILPQNTIAIAFDVRDDGSGAKLRVSLRNSLNEQVLLPALTLERPGWRHVVVTVPQSSADAARLSSIYVIGVNAGAQLSGSIVVRDLKATVAGSP